MTTMTDQKPNDDVVRRNVKRELACKLTTEDEIRISKTMVMKKRELRVLETDLETEKKKRKDQIDDLADEVARMESDLDRGAEDRTVPCNDVFRRGDDGTGWIHTIRLDTHEVVERKAASAHETQRYLPNVDGFAPPVPSGSILEDALAKQKSAEQSTDAEDDVPGDDDEEGDGEKPAKKPKPERFDAALLANGKCALRSATGESACTLEVGHGGLHISPTHRWKARRPKPTEAGE